MATTAILYFGDNSLKTYNKKQYMVLEAQCRFSRGYNNFRPITSASCDSVEVRIIAPDRSDLDIYNWLAEGSFKSGKLVFDNTSVKNQATNTKVLFFNDAICYSVHEDFNVYNADQRYLTMKFYAEEVIEDDVTFKHLL